MKVEPDPLVPDSYVRSKGQVYIRQTRWGPVAQKWPRPHSSGKSAGSAWRRVEFGYIAAATKNVHALDYETARNLTKNTEYVPRDVLMLAMTGKLYEIHDTAGIIWRSWRMTVPNAQDVLDQLTNTPGALIVRGTTFWEWITPGNANDVLTMLDGVPDWAPSQSGGGSTTPEAFGWRTPAAPTFSDFSLETGAASNVVITQQTAFGFTMKQPCVNAIQHAPFGATAPTSSTWTWRVGLRAACKPNLQFLNCGLYLKKSGNTKLITFGHSFRTSGAPIAISRWNSLTSFNSDQYLQTMQGDIVPNPIWFQIEYDGTHYTYFVSVDGLTFVRLFQESSTAWLPSVADRIGLTVDAENADTTASVALTCFDWHAN